MAGMGMYGDGGSGLGAWGPARGGLGEGRSCGARGGRLWVVKTGSKGFTATVAWQLGACILQWRPKELNWGRKRVTLTRARVLK